MSELDRRMLQRVDLAPESLESYEGVAGKERIDELRALAAPLHGARVAHINATAYGGGVSELLRSLVPLYRALEMSAEWLVIPGNPPFFQVTKGIHNALQGAGFDLTEEAKRTYIAHNEMVAAALERGY